MADLLRALRAQDSRADARHAEVIFQTRQLGAAVEAVESRLDAVESSASAMRDAQSELAARVARLEPSIR